eukprot:scaffold15948_cov43-Cyclotella_meneghiniana.AAC.3
MRVEYYISDVEFRAINKLYSAAVGMASAFGSWFEGGSIGGFLYVIPSRRILRNHAGALIIAVCSCALFVRLLKKSDRISLCCFKNEHISLGN